MGQSTCVGWVLTPILHKLSQGNPALQAVVQRFGGGRSIGNALALKQHPLVQGVKQRFGFGLPDAASLTCPP